MKRDRTYCDQNEDDDDGTETDERCLGCQLHVRV